MEGLQVAFRKTQRASAEGMQVVPGSAPEVVQQHDSENILAVTVGHRISWHRLFNKKICGTRIIWTVITASVFAIGVGLGCAIVKSMESKRKDPPSIGVHSTYVYLTTLFTINKTNRIFCQVCYWNCSFEFDSVFSTDIFEHDHAHFNDKCLDWVPLSGHSALDEGDGYIPYHLIFFYFCRYSYIVGYFGIKPEPPGKLSHLVNRGSSNQSQS
jgi:hypothetical protein